MSFPKSNTNRLGSNPWNVPVAKLRHVGTHCRYPNISGAVRQWCSASMHYAFEDISWFRLAFANYFGQNETAGAGNLRVTTGLEYPVNRDDLQFIEYQGGVVGTGPSGADIFSDGFQPDTIIRAGTWYKLWHFHENPTAGIPFHFGGPQPWTNNAANGLSIISGTAGGLINYLMFTATAAERNALVNTDASSNQMISPLAILTSSKSKSIGILGDSRTAIQSSAAPVNFDYVSDASLLQGAGERVFGPLGPWMNLSASGDSAYNFTTGGLGVRRANYLRFVTDVVNLYGTNDFGSQADLAAMQALDLKIKNLATVRGKRFWGGTIVPKTTSTDQFLTLAGQTVTAKESLRKAVNAWRLSAADVYDGGVIDYAGQVEDTATGTWKVSAAGSQVTGNMTVGSNTFAAGVDVFSPSHNGQVIYVTGAGASSAALIGRMVYVNSKQVNIVNAITGAAVNCATAVTAAVTYVDCRKFSADGTHETQVTGKLYSANLAPVAAAAFNR